MWESGTQGSTNTKGIAEFLAQFDFEGFCGDEMGRAIVMILIRLKHAETSCLEAIANMP